MPIFRYKAKNNEGGNITGQIEARSREEAVELISQQNLLPITVEDQTQILTTSNRFAVKKVKAKELLVFSRRMSNLIKAGIPILRALKIVSEQTPNRYFKGVIDSIGSGIKDGRPLSNCLSDYPNIFSSLYITMIHVGEEGGNLKEMLFRISEYQQRQNQIYSKVKGALAYPILMAVVGIMTIFFILTFVMPRITKLYSNLNELLPLPTKILMNISDYLRSGGFWIILILLGLILLLIKQRSYSKRGRFAISRFQLRLPLFGEFIRKVELARFCGTVALLLKNGLPLLKALKISVQTLQNEQIKQELEATQKDLELGSSFGSSLQKVQTLPLMLVNLLIVGEESGLLEETLMDAADSYEQEINEAIKTMTNLLEPLMILGVGVVVGFIVIAMLLPIFQMDVLAG